MAIGAPVNLGGANMSAIATSATVSLTTNTTVATGDRIIVFVGSSGTNRTLSSVTDSAGNTYTIDQSEIDATNAGNSYIASAPCTVQLSSGGTITATWSSSVSSARCIAAVSVSSLGSKDVSVGRTATTATWDGGALVTTINDELLASCAFRASLTTSSPTTNYTELFDFNGSSSTFSATYRIVSSTGSYTGGGLFAAAGSRWMGCSVGYGISAQNQSSTLSPTVTSTPSLPRVINKGLANF